MRASRAVAGVVLATAFAHVLVVSIAMAVEDPDISVRFDDSLPFPGTTGEATFIVENLSDADATFEGAIRFGEDDPAVVVACEHAVAPAHADTEVACTVESAADACDQVLALFMAYSWVGGPVEVSTTTSGDFDGVGPCPHQPGFQGSWAGSVTIGDEVDLPVAITLADCSQGFGEPCGKMTFRDETGVGCTFSMSIIDPVQLPTLGDTPPLQADQLVYQVGTGCFECDGIGLSDTYLYVRETAAGGLEMTPVWPTLEGTFVVVAAPAEPNPPSSFEVGPTTVPIGGEIKVSVAGFSQASLYLDASGRTDGMAYPIGEIALDEAGSGTVVHRLRKSASAGPAEVVLIGTLYRSYCTVEALRTINIVRNDAAGELPTPPPTDTAVDQGAPEPGPQTAVWLIVYLASAAAAVWLTLARRPH